MNLDQIRQLATTIIYTATGKQEVDDFQLNMIINFINRKYWRDAVSHIGTMFTKDTPDIVTSQNGQIDYSGSINQYNDIPEQSAEHVGWINGWTATNLTVALNQTIAPNDEMSASLLTDTATNAVHSLQAIGPFNVSQSGVVTFYAKAGTANFIYIGASANGAFTWFNLQQGIVATNGQGVCSCTPAPANGFLQGVGVTSSPSPTNSPTGWYKCTAQTVTGVSPVNADRVVVGMSVTDGVSSYSGTGSTVYVWGARRWFFDSMIDPMGIYMPVAVEVKFLGRYIHLDYEIIQDRYIYNIAFGQVQVLIPSAWTLMGEKILLLPLVAAPQTVRISYVPNLGDLDINGADAMQGKLSSFHELISYEAAASFVGKDAKGMSIFLPLQELKEQWLTYLQSRQRQEGRHIRYTPYE